MMLRHRARMGSLFTGLALVGTSCGGDEFTQSAGDAGAAGADASAGGGAGAQSGGSAGSQGGTSGAAGSAHGGASGQGGSAHGGASGQGGSAHGGASGQGGSSEAGSGQGGSGANAGSGGGPGCNFDACNVQQGPPQGDCNICVTAVCAQSPGCCANSGAWGPYCVFLAHTIETCACGTLKCITSNSGMTSSGACIPPGAPCNPLTPSMCGVGTHCTFETVPSPQFQCTSTGAQAGCATCSANQHCGSGMSCIFNRCVWPCCVDSDCGPEAVCKGGILLANNTFGVCTNPAASTD